ncbi:flagellar biosynthesis anti-sigma factor FlgM [Rhodopirellula sp.]|nr:flagellar biosynthesis anti-sigma factor FlgM [Rhodopirellula sp.]
MSTIFLVGVLSVEILVPSGSNSIMQIYGPFRVSTSQSVSPNNNRIQTPSSVDKPPKASTAPVDQLDLSSSVSDVNRLQTSAGVAGGGDIRVDRVAEIRRQIANGTYETPEKLDAALDRILDRFA